MRKLILIIVLLIAAQAAAQDTPLGWTTNYRLRMYKEGAYPSADSVNKNLIDIDAAIKARDRRIDSLFKYNVVITGQKDFASRIAYSDTIAITSSREIPHKQYVDNWYNYLKARIDSVFANNKTFGGNEIFTGGVTFKGAFYIGDGTNCSAIDFRSQGYAGISIGGAPKLEFNEVNGAYWETTFPIYASEFRINQVSINTKGTLTNVVYRGDTATVNYLNSTNGYNVRTATVIDQYGFFKPVKSDDQGAPNNSIYYSTDQSALVYKDVNGSVQRLY